ncbi:MAG: TetR family transcriptional regulator, partial [Marinobacter sp.]|nr:TetR family transcriptional regulator [Marinobacter sp.]
MHDTGTLEEAGTGQQAVQYSGRKAFRAKSEQRRVQILEATLRIVAKEGIRGIKHRSVAKEAGVPLAS